MVSRGVRRIAILLPAVVAVLVAGLLIYAHLEARRAPLIRRATVALSDWPAGAPPLRVMLLSDIHMGNSTMDAERLGRIVEGVNALHPDLVLIAGDFVAGHAPHSAESQAAALKMELARLRSRLGVVAVFGNHDHWTGQAQVSAALAEAGVTTLQNDAVERGPLAIAGVADAHTHQQNIAATWARLRPLPGARIVLTHAPEVVRELPRDATLVLAGHTHCNQVVLPLVRPLRPSRRHPYVCGLYHDAGRTIVVTGGLGTSVAPLRLGAPPDEWLLTLGPVGGRPAG
jgi:predicted MPP superfamily phosphohydrolase